MGIYPVLIYDISGLEPKFHWDGMKNGLSTYVKCVYKRMSNFEFSLYLSQATGSVQISLDFSFKYDSKGVHYFFLRLLVPKL